MPAHEQPFPISAAVSPAVSPAAAVSQIAPALRIACPHCNQFNEVARTQWLGAPMCAFCGGDLHPLQPFALDAASFAGQVQQSDGAVIVHFAEPNCTPCILMDVVFEQAARHRRDLRFAVCDVEAEAALALQYRIRNAPTLVCFERGLERARISGTLSLGQLLDWLARSLRPNGGAGQ